MKSGANRKVGHKVGKKREKWGEKSEARKVGYKMGQQKVGTKRKVRHEKSGAKRKVGREKMSQEKVGREK